MFAEFGDMKLFSSRMPVPGCCICKKCKLNILETEMEIVSQLVRRCLLFLNLPEEILCVD
jgi:hypothetical protein